VWGWVLEIEQNTKPWLGIRLSIKVDNYEYQKLKYPVLIYNPGYQKIKYGELSQLRIRAWAAVEYDDDDDYRKQDGMHVFTNMIVW
jgi:hypothetical protein